MYKLGRATIMAALPSHINIVNSIFVMCLQHLHTASHDHIVVHSFVLWPSGLSTRKFQLRPPFP